MKKYRASNLLLPIIFCSVSTSAMASNDSPSDYLRCDGSPNNVTTGETAARLLGAVTLLGLFAPAPESADPSARLRGSEGIVACTGLIEGEGMEGQLDRRLQLILARANHHIEAGHFDAALIDTNLARSQASAAGLDHDIYFQQLRARGISIIERGAYIRSNNLEAARNAGLFDVTGRSFSYTIPFAFEHLGRLSLEPSAEEEHFWARSAAILWVSKFAQIGRLTDQRHFPEAVAVYEDIFQLIFLTKNQNIFPARFPTPDMFALAAALNAMSGNFSHADELAESARGALLDEDQAHNSQSSRALAAEYLDLLTITKLAHEGNMVEARRLYSGRTTWTVPNLGLLMELNHRLREGADPAQLVGPLARTETEIFEDARMSASDRIVREHDDNNHLFRYINFGGQSASVYESFSREIWRIDRSRLIQGNPDGWQQIHAPGWGMAGMDGMLLHAALIARARGQEGFMIVTNAANPRSGIIRFGAHDDPKMLASMFLPAADVIAELSPLFPTPESIRTRQRSESRAMRSNAQN